MSKSFRGVETRKGKKISQTISRDVYWWNVSSFKVTVSFELKLFVGGYIVLWILFLPPALWRDIRHWDLQTSAHRILQLLRPRPRHPDRWVRTQPALLFGKLFKIISYFTAARLKAHVFFKCLSQTAESSYRHEHYWLRSLFSDYNKTQPNSVPLSSLLFTAKVNSIILIWWLFFVQLYLKLHKKPPVCAAGTHRIRACGTQETDAISFGCLVYRHSTTFAPWGFVDTWERCFTFSHCLLWILHQNTLNSSEVGDGGWFLSWPLGLLTTLDLPAG